MSTKLELPSSSLLIQDNFYVNQTTKVGLSKDSKTTYVIIDHFKNVSVN